MCAGEKKMVAAMVVPPDGQVLDVACGTGDVALEILRQKGAGVKIVGLDFSPGMLGLAREKILRSRSSAISLAVGDALALPIVDGTVHAVTIAFGIRNIQDKSAALKAFHQCLVPGGMLLVLELSTPQKSRLRNAYLTYFQRVLPLIGRLFSSHQFAYTYLPASVSRFPAPDVFMDLMAKAGFRQITCRGLTMGIVNLFVGIKRS
jgi:demethylmenaquinone methyltransferase / 2-methoxy-6-polyprenyl-1,4-benzoquinol methylase